MNRPLTLVCYICGRQFGTKSLGIHLKSCQQKWENQQSHKPPKQRRPCPNPPPGLKQLLAKDNISRQDIIAFNNGSFNTFMEQALVECEYCGRKFNEKSLVPHQKACKTNPMIRKHYVSNQQKQKMGVGNQNIPMSGMKKNDPYQNMKFQESNLNTQDLVPCRKCGRKFNPDRVAKHQKVCKQSNVPKKQQQQKQTITASSNIKPSMMKKKQNPTNQKPAKWKIQHQQFVNAMKAMRQIKKFQQNGGNLRDLPPPPPSNYDHYVQCKYCGRKYAADVAQRHIPKCANIINKPGGIKPSKIQQKYIGSTGAGSKKPQTPLMNKKIETPIGTNKSYQLTKPSTQQKLQMEKYQMTKSPLLKPNLKTSGGVVRR